MLFPCGQAVADTAPIHVRHLSPVPTPEKFASDLDFLCRSLCRLDLCELEKLLPEQLANSPPNSFMVSFDDSLREDYEVIAPIL